MQVARSDFQRGLFLQRTLLTLGSCSAWRSAAAAVLAGLGRPLGPAGVAAGRQEGPHPRATAVSAATGMLPRNLETPVAVIESKH